MMPSNCPKCDAPGYRLYRYGMPTEKNQKYLCAKCDSTFTRPLEKVETNAGD